MSSTSSTFRSEEWIICHTEGDFRVVECGMCKGLGERTSHFNIQHRCNLKERDPQIWSAFQTNIEADGMIKCTQCNEYPSEGIYVMFLFLND